MKRLWMLLPALLLLAGPALGDEDLRAMAAKVKDYRTKFRLIAQGAEAVQPLMAQVGSDDAWLAFESRSALRWIAIHAARDPGEAEAVAAELKPYAGMGTAATREARAFAAELLGELGTPSAVDPLRAGLVDDDVVAAAAVAAMARIPGEAATQALLDALPQVPAERKALLYEALGARGDESALPVLEEAAKSGVAAAVRALGTAGFADAEETLATLCRRKAPGAFAALLAVARAQADTAMLARLYGHAQDDEERLAVIRGAAGRCVQEGALVEVLGQAMENPALRTAAQKALLCACPCFNPKTAALLYRKILAEADDEAVVMRALAGLGRSADESAADLVIPHLAASRPAVRTTAIVALGGIPGRRATEALLEAFRTRQEGGDEAELSLLVRVLRERGAVEAVPLLTTWLPKAPGALKDQAGEALLALADLSDPAAARAVHLELLSMGVKEAALRGLARSGNPDAVPRIADALEGAGESVRSAAQDALVAIGARAAEAGDVSGAKEAYHAALDAGAVVENRLRLLGETIEITAREGRVSAWWLLGPFPAPQEAWGAWGPPTSTNTSPDEAIRYENRDYVWEPVQVGGADAIVDLDSRFKPNDNVMAYAFTEIHLRKARDAVLKMGSDDGLVVWVNGEKVHEKLVPRGITVDEDTVKVHLKEGKNTLVLMVCEIGGGWGFCCRIEDDKGRPLKFKMR